MRIHHVFAITISLLLASVTFADDPRHITEFERPLIVEFTNNGGYTGWFRISWTNFAGEVKTYTSKNRSKGEFYRIEVPADVHLNSVRVEGYTNTGLLWSKHLKIFSFTWPNGITVQRFQSRDYYGIRTWGTTFAPKWGYYTPKMGVHGGLDPYADHPVYCTRLTTINTDIYTGLVNPVRTEYHALNACQYPVIFTLTGQSGMREVRVEANSTAVIYNGYYKGKYYVEKAD